MKQKLSPIIALLLAWCIFYNVSGHYVIFLIQQSQVKSLVLEMVTRKETKLVMFRFTNEQAKKYLAFDENEFYYNNELYDIAAKEADGNGVKLFCYKDVNEKSLIHHFCSHVRNNSPSTQKAKHVKSAFSFCADELFFKHRLVFFKDEGLQTSIITFLNQDQFSPGTLAHPPEIS